MANLFIFLCWFIKPVLLPYIASNFRIVGVNRIAGMLVLPTFETIYRHQRHCVGLLQKRTWFNQNFSCAKRRMYVQNIHFRMAERCIVGIKKSSVKTTDLNRGETS